MKFALLVATMLLPLMLIGCGEDDGASITNPTSDKEGADLGLQITCGTTGSMSGIDIGFSTPVSGPYIIEIMGATGNTVKTFTGRASQGLTSVHWSGLNNSGEQVKSGHYVIGLAVANFSGMRAIWVFF